MAQIVNGMYLSVVSAYSLDFYVYGVRLQLQLQLLHLSKNISPFTHNSTENFHALESHF